MILGQQLVGVVNHNGLTMLLFILVDNNVVVFLVDNNVVVYAC